MKNKIKGITRRNSNSLPMLRRALKKVEKHFEGQTLNDNTQYLDSHFVKQRIRIKDEIELITELKDNIR